MFAKKWVCLFPTRQNKPQARTPPPPANYRQATITQQMFSHEKKRPNARKKLMEINLESCSPRMTNGAHQTDHRQVKIETLSFSAQLVPVTEAQQFFFLPSAAPLLWKYRDPAVHLHLQQRQRSKSRQTDRGMLCGRQKKRCQRLTLFLEWWSIERDRKTQVL